MVDAVRAKRVVAVAAVMAALLPACSRSPSPEEIAARKAREDAILQASQEEERRKDRERHAAAAQAAEAEAETIRAPSEPIGADPPAERPTLTMLGQVHPVQTTEEEVIAHATARVEMALANPRSMLVRSPQLREQNTIVCLEVNARDRSGGYTGYVPVIVTPRKVLVHKPITEGRDVADVSSTLEFNQWNERVRCW